MESTGVHDWTKVPAGIFHHFHQAWINAICTNLNSCLPPDYYALAEQIASGVSPDAIVLERRRPESISESTGSLALLEAPPKVSFAESLDDIEMLARRKNVAAVRHVSDDSVIAFVEIVSPGNKSTQYALDNFTRKTAEFLLAGIHLLILDLLPPTPRDANGIHPEIWGAMGQASEFRVNVDKPLTLAAYQAWPKPQAYIETVGVGDALPSMAVFLKPTSYLPFELQPTYDQAFAAVPRVWRETLS